MNGSSPIARTVMTLCFVSAAVLLLAQWQQRDTPVVMAQPQPVSIQPDGQPGLSGVGNPTTTLPTGQPDALAKAGGDRIANSSVNPASPGGRSPVQTHSSFLASILRIFNPTVSLPSSQAAQNSSSISSNSATSSASQSNSSSSPLNSQKPASPISEPTILPTAQPATPAPPTNPVIPSWAPVRVGKMAPALQQMVQTYLVVNLSDRRVYVYRGTVLQNQYEIAVGKAGWETPSGTFQINDMQIDPHWKHPITGRDIGPGPDNPLGSRWIGFWSDGEHVIGFHGTNQDDSVGQAISHGCIRMRNSDIEALFQQVTLGMRVVVVS